MEPSNASTHARTMTLDGVELTLAHPDRIDVQWIGAHHLREQMMAAWMVIDPADLPLCPRLMGRPGIGKTTLAYAVARQIDQEVYIYQCTMDTRPEDLLVTPVISEHGHIAYHASALVTAMLRGQVCILDEANRMSEKSWASLAPLLDQRRYVESIVTGLKIHAHPDFRICCTMNDDASTYEVPEYIQSRLQPRIEVTFPNRTEEEKILRLNVPFTGDQLLDMAVTFLQKAHQLNLRFTPRDGINILRYCLKLAKMKDTDPTSFFDQAVAAILGPDGLDFLNGIIPASATHLHTPDAWEPPEFSDENDPTEDDLDEDDDTLDWR